LSTWRNYIAHGLPSELKSDPYRQELVYQWLLNVANSRIQQTPQVTQDQMKAEIENVTKELADRIVNIEKRIPVLSILLCKIVISQFLKKRQVVTHFSYRV